MRRSLAPGTGGIGSSFHVSTMREGGEDSTESGLFVWIVVAAVAVTVLGATVDESDGADGGSGGGGSIRIDCGGGGGGYGAL